MFSTFSQKVRIVHASQSISYTSSGLRHLSRFVGKTNSSWSLFFLADMNENGGSSKKCSWGFNSLVRRKQVDSVHLKNDHGHHHHQLAKKLTAFDLVAIGMKLFSRTNQHFVFLTMFLIVFLNFSKELEQQ